VGGVVVRLVVVQAALGHVVVASFRGVCVTGVIRASSSRLAADLRERGRGKGLGLQGTVLATSKRRGRCRWRHGGDHLRVTHAVSVLGGDSSGDSS
jgi:hypothetical protein